jgi:hypothetical protein
MVLVPFGQLRYSMVSVMPMLSDSTMGIPSQSCTRLAMFGVVRAALGATPAWLKIVTERDRAS